MPLFSVSSQIGELFTKWLTGSGGGCKKDRAAQQIAKRCFKFLKFCCEDEEELSFEVLDFSLCSHSLLFKFIDYLQDECKLGHGGRLGYIDAISELIDFRKINGVMSKLVFDAIGKFIHPMRYRQIVGTQSLNLLTSKEQQILSEDQNAVLRLQKFTIKSSDRAKLLSKLTSVYKSYKARKARRWIGKCKRGLAAQLQVLQLQSKQQKQRARPLKKRISRPQTNCEFKEIIVGC